MRLIQSALVSLMLLIPATGLTQDAAPAPVKDAAPVAVAGTPDSGAIKGTVDAATPAPAPAPVAPAPPEDIGGAAENLNFLVQAAKGGHWGLFLGVLLTLLVWLLDKFIGVKKRVGKAALPWVAAGLGIVSAGGISLASGLPVTEGVVQGFMTGASAVGLWELLFKHLLKPAPTPETEPEPEPESDDEPEPDAEA